MSTAEEPSDRETRRAREDAARKRRLRAKVFGEVLPDTTRDERGDASDSGQSTDEWLKRQIPPHHG